MDLSLGEEIKNEVSNTSKFNLKLHGSRVHIKVPNFHRQNGLKFLKNNNITCLLVPLDEATKGVLCKIESFAKAKFSHRTYKRLWLNNAMYINIPHWCKYQRINLDGSLTALPQNSDFGRGTYNIIIHASRVCVGPHKAD